MTGHKLNIGAASTYLPGFTNVDIDYYTLEHIPDHLFATREMHRVLRHDGRVGDVSDRRQLSGKMYENVQILVK